MNTTAKALIFAVVSVASAAAIGMGLADHAAQSTAAKAGVVKLEPVVIVGKRVHTVAQLPRVVVEGRRTMVAAAKAPAKATA